MKKDFGFVKIYCDSTIYDLLTHISRLEEIYSLRRLLMFSGVFYALFEKYNISKY